MQNIVNEEDNSEMSNLEIAQMDEIQEILNSEELEPTTALNILLHAINVSYDKEHFNDLDRALIARALGCFKDYIDRGEDFTIKVK